MKLLTTPPTAALLASIERVLREGIPQIPALTPASAWATGQPCPAGHPLFPSGTRIYDYLRDEEVEGEIFVELLTDEAAAASTRGDDRIWKIPVEINLWWDRDIWDGPEGEELQASLKMLLTSALTLPDATVQSAQARLSTAGLHLWGTRDSENFTDLRFDKLSVKEGHPFLSINFVVKCSGIYQPPA